MTISICFVCLGNICRSPTAEGIFLKVLDDEGLSDRVEVDSAGTGACHVGERADPRSRAVAEARGVALHSRARQFLASDFDRFDHVVAMDRRNLRHLHDLAPDLVARGKVTLFRRFEGDGMDRDVPDPYLEGGFEGVFDICERASEGLLAHLRRVHGL
jgi:protein-tyrosine phosphatase